MIIRYRPLYTKKEIEEAIRQLSKDKSMEIFLYSLFFAETEVIELNPSDAEFVHRARQYYIDKIEDMTEEVNDGR